MHSQNAVAQTDRRNFLKKSLALILGGAAALVPGITAIRVLLDPLQRHSTAGVAIKIAPLDALPADGVPRKFPVLASKEDAWNKFQNVPIGAVYLRRTKDNQLEALNVVCPHAGCFVDFSSARGEFICPCHNSRFNVDGAIASRDTPSPRPLDSLTAEVRDDGAVWVYFQNFRAGLRRKTPVA
jgi:menaquinol-cytochrome c reductase iron-sulfur subunit